MRLPSVLSLAIVILALSVSPVVPAEIEGVHFRDRLTTRGVDLVIHGVGLLRYKIVFRGYVAALYRGEEVEPKDVLADVPRRLELHYFWAIDGEQFAGAGDEILRRNVSPETFDSLQPKLAKINAAYRDVEPGDRYALTYVPGEGTELAWNGEPLVVVEGADFADAYFRIWLGEEPIDKGLRDELLRGT